MQKSLFEDHNNDKSSKNIVKVKSTKQSPLSKTQRRFNRLTSRVAKLKTEITTVSEKLQLLHRFHEKEVGPEIEKLAAEKVRLGHLLHEKRKDTKLSKLLNEKLDALILDMLDDAFHIIEPTEQDKELFSAYNDISFDEERQKSEVSNFFADLVFEQTGMKIDPEDFLNDQPDLDKLKELFESQVQDAKDAAPKRKKNQRTLEKEKREKQKEELKQKSLRSIYLSLAKILHPDTEKDPELRVQKEEYMKRVTVAYNNKNLTELLELEIQWVKNHENQLENTPEDVLKLYIELLDEQIVDLEETLFMTGQHPKYQAVVELLPYGMKKAMAILENDKLSYMATYSNYAESSDKLEHAKRSRGAIVECIEKFYSEEEDFGDIFGEMAEMMLRNNNWR